MRSGDATDNKFVTLNVQSNIKIVLFYICVLSITMSIKRYVHLIVRASLENGSTKLNQIYTIFYVYYVDGRRLQKSKIRKVVPELLPIEA